MNALLEFRIAQQSRLVMTDNRNKLKTAALNNVQRNGLKGLSFRTLADEVGIKSSSVHYYFPEKSDLATALIEQYSIQFFESLTDIASQRWNLRRKITAFIAIFEQVAKNEQLCLCGMMAAEVEHLNDQNKQLLKTFFKDTERWLSDLIEAHHDELNTTLSTTQLAKSMVSSLEGALLLDRVAGNSQRLKAQKELFLALI